MDVIKLRLVVIGIVLCLNAAIVPSCLARDLSPSNKATPAELRALFSQEVEFYGRIKVFPNGTLEGQSRNGWSSSSGKWSISTKGEWCLDWDNFNWPGGCRTLYRITGSSNKFYYKRDDGREGEYTFTKVDPDPTDEDIPPKPSEEHVLIAYSGTPYWAGHQATMEDPGGNTLRIKYSTDGRKYHVNWNYWGSSYRGVCSGSVSDKGVLETVECRPKGRNNPRSICGTVLKIEKLCSYAGGLHAGPWLNTKLMEKRQDLAKKVAVEAKRGSVIDLAKKTEALAQAKVQAAEKKKRALEKAKALAQAKAQAAEKKDPALEKARVLAKAKAQAAKEKKRVLEKARALAQAMVRAAEKKKQALEKAKTQAQAKYLSKRSNAEHYLAVIKEFVKLNPSVLDPLVIARFYGPSLSEVKKGRFNKPGSKFSRLVAYMRKTASFEAFLQTQNKKRAENEATKLADLRSEISSVVDALKARLSADPLASDAYKLLAIIEKFDKRPDKVVNLSALQESRDNLVASAANFGISVSGTVTKKAALPVQARSAAKNHGVAVIIGNKNYSGDIPDVAFAHNDAKAMKRYVMDFLGFRKGNIVDLRDASQAQMMSAFGVKGNYKGLLWQYLRSGISDVVVFYSGHGVPGLKDGRGYLLPVDSHPQTAELNGYPIDLLYENLGKLAARSVMVFIDSCFSGGSANGMLVKAASPVFVRTIVPKPVKGMTVVTAASNDQVASWDEKAKHGLFTKYLLDGLYGKADGKRYGNGDGRITLGEIKAYLDGEMTYQARRRFGRVQEVTVQGNKEGFLTQLSTSSPRP